MWRTGDQVGLIEFFLSCLAVSIHTCRRADDVSRRTTNRRKPRPAKVQKAGWIYDFYDFMNLWFYDSPFWSSNFTHSNKISPCGGQMARSVSLSFFSPCLDVYRYMEKRRSCFAHDHEPTVNPTRESSEDGSFTILWFYEFMILCLSLLAD